MGNNELSAPEVWESIPWSELVLFGDEPCEAEGSGEFGGIGDSGAGVSDRIFEISTLGNAQSALRGKRRGLTALFCHERHTCKRPRLV